MRLKDAPDAGMSTTMTAAQAYRRRLPVGAEVVPGGGVHFRVWAPGRTSVEVVFEGGAAGTVELRREAAGYFAGLAAHAAAGALYRFRLDGGDALYPDPASRFQPDGPHGPSQVIDHTTFRWTDDAWPGVTPDGQVLYEMHVGTFTKEGTWAAAARELPALRELGVTCLEVMPVADFAGRWGWGYDGVDLFAPTRLYGTPDDFRRFVDAAHAAGLGVILDVVYNHFGPDGNYLAAFTKDYFSTKHKGEWGDPMNFDGENAHGVRDFYLANARYWVEEFRLDGYRYDATQAILDDSPEHVLTQISRVAREAGAARGRSIYLVNENEPQHTRLVRPPEQGGCGMDALWNDDFHHSAMVALTGRNEAYYEDHLGKPQEFISAAKWGYLFQGQYYTHQKKRRGTPAFDLPPTAFVNFLENHDQVANFATGQRVHQMASPAQYRAAVGLLLLMPQTPMLFQGQEWACSSPFQYFVDHNPELTKLVCKGRAEFMAQFPSVATPEMRARLPDPGDPATFERCKLDPAERQRPGHAEVYQLYKDLLRLRREEAAFRGRWPGGLDGSVLGQHTFCLRFFEPGGDDRLVIVNLDGDRHMSVAPEPLLAPPPGTHWDLQWSSEYPRYGGTGALPLESPDESWRIPGRTTSVLRPVPLAHDEPEPLRAPPHPADAREGE